MTNDYAVIVGERDQERFRRFRTGYDRDIIKSIGKFSDAKNIWALGPSTSHDLWSSIQSNDRIFFAEMDSLFCHCAIVQSKITDKTEAIRIWGDSPRIREHERLILFSDVYDIDVHFHKLCRQGGIKPSSMSTNIYALKNSISEIPENSITGTIIVSDDGAPNKKTEVVTRFIRDSAKVRQLKSTYNNECQICGYAINTLKSRYSEVHHLHPLKDGGDDDFDNMLVLCPTHHVEFDYKVIGIDSDKKTIINKNGDKIGILTMANEHKLNNENILFHLMGMHDELS